MELENKMNVLLLGSGGREHAIAWKLAKSPKLNKLFTLPGNPGTAQFGENITGDPLSAENVLEAVRQHNIELVIVGPEAPLEAGVSNAVRREGVAVFGPSAAAAQLETSKAFAKNFMQRHGIPTARFKVFQEIAEAKAYLEEIPFEYVIKVSGLAAGKGVFLPESKQEAEDILTDIFENQAFGHSGKKVVIEERLTGTEVSLLAFTDEKDIALMPPAQDHKRLLNDDEGPNTGGMGVFAPSPYCSPSDIQLIEENIILPTIRGMENEGMPYSGVLYAGVMLTAEGPKLLEYNCRFGDPETQVILPLLDADLLEISCACATDTLSILKDQIHWKDQVAACIILASEGYPGTYPKGIEITGMEALHPEDLIFQAGTNETDGKLITNGGRVLGVTATGNSLTEAVEQAYLLTNKIHFEGMQYRTDIGKPKSAYQDAGVSIESWNEAAKMITPAVKSTYTPAVLSHLGSFGGLFDAKNLQQMNHPVLVSSTDGVGTKVILAAQSGRLHSIGQDIVNHCVNDILVQGARPLFFLDYFASSKLIPMQLAEVVTGISTACKAANCALIGGETAEMPSVYTEHHFDLVGTIIGAVEKDQILPKKSIQPEDVLIGLGSSGPHTNGYSLIRKLFKDVPLNHIYPELGVPLEEVLLEPHKSYLPVLDTLLSNSNVIKGMAHITGGGFIDNIPRILPKGCGVKIDRSSWEIPPIFTLMQHLGNISDIEMMQIFNMGIGMILVIDKNDVENTREQLSEDSRVIGEVIAGEGVSFA